jgi:spore maturation protein CgeB
VHPLARVHKHGGIDTNRGEKPRVLVLLMSYTYGMPELGHSFEYYNVLPAFERLPFDTRQFDFAQEILDHGYWVANANLRRIIDEWQPHVMLLGLYQEQIDFELVSWISRETGTTTVGWFSDDHWRFDGFSRYWASALDWVVTTDVRALSKYREIGQHNVILSQWAVNDATYRPSGGPIARDVAFVGARYGRRGKTIDFLLRQGISISAWGAGWPNGKATQEQMVDIFSTSKISLNLAESSTSARSRFFGGKDPQIKARVFEVPACGGLLLTDGAPELEKYYEIGTEIEVFDGRKDLALRIRSLLDDEPRRAAMAKAGYERTLRDHTWTRRIAAIFSEIGMLDDAGPFRIKPAS